MQNSTRSGAVKDLSADKGEPSAREADRTGKAGDMVERKPFTVDPQPAVIEIRDGRVAVQIGKHEPFRKVSR
jgi:hypothetical protein